MLGVPGQGGGSWEKGLQAQQLVWDLESYGAADEYSVLQ